MDTSDALSTMKKFLITQVVPPRASAVQKVVARMQTFAQRTCQLFCLPLQPLPCGNISCCSAQTHQLEPGVKKQDHSQSVQSVPPTILIVNISNSTLIDCVIGDSCPSAAAERQPLMQEAELQKHAEVQLQTERASRNTEPSSSSSSSSGLCFCITTRAAQHQHRKLTPQLCHHRRQQPHAH
ncbi:hypothetical protein FQA47_010222 [Oryzias melastigma]|uniref:Uncharacterized protein n=1 Tax=Oryzias melastigma TaxID=30732 RepID=A0A834F3T8_ORYME|nr:hypothetical protein FQA47_010222 [Oryzias melastigma]